MTKLKQGKSTNWFKKRSLRGLKKQNKVFLYPFYGFYRVHIPTIVELFDYSLDKNRWEESKKKNCVSPAKADIAKSVMNRQNRQIYLGLKWV